MRKLRALVVMAAAGAALLGARPALAADVTAVSLSLSQRWYAAQAGAWTPYVATVRNQSPTDFVGDVYLTPFAGSGKVPPGGWPDYRAHVAVAHGTERSVTFYVVEPPSGYQASLLDPGGRTLIGGVTVGRDQGLEGGLAVGVLSDQTQAAARIEAMRPLAETQQFTGGAGLRVSRFGSAQAFPTNAVYLSGLSTVIIDDFDVNTLSEAQVRTLRDFVGLGGSLVAAGGSAWRRTLLPLADHQIGPLRPVRTQDLSIQPLADLVARTSTLTVPAAVGDFGSARTLVGAPGGPPLAIESELGAGRIVELAFDPLAEPLAGDESGIAAFAWSVALDRALEGATSAVGRGFGPKAMSVAVVAKGTGPPLGAAAVPPANPEELLGILSNTAAAAVPPVGLLGGLLVLYVLITGPVNYAVLRAAGRRELMWATVPVIALFFTSTAYAAGFGVHGASYLDNEVQVLRLSPTGAVEIHSFHGVFPPHRGDFTVAMPANTLASTALGGLSAVAGGGEKAVVETGSRTEVQLKGTAYGGMRTLSTLTVSRPPVRSGLGLEAHLRLVAGRIQGTLKNDGDQPVRSLRLVSGTGQQADLVPGELAAHATAAVDARLAGAGSATPFPQGSGVYSPNPSSPAEYRREGVLRLAAAQAVTGGQGEWALVGLTDPVGSLSIEGGRPTHTGLAAVVSRVGLEAVDSLAGISPRPSLLASGSTVPYHYDVFDLAIPAGYPGPLKLSYFSYGTPAAVQTGVLQPALPIRSIEVYDWQAGTWRALPAAASAPRTQTMTASLTAGETLNGVRVRVNEQNSSLGLAQLQLVGGQQP